MDARDARDIVERLYRALTGLMVAADYLEGKGYDAELEEAERAADAARRYLVT